MIWLGDYRWSLHRLNECRCTTAMAGLQEESPARQWLQQFKYDSYSMSALRGLLLEERNPRIWKLNGDDVIDEAAQLLSRGVWHVHRAAPPVPVGGGAEEEIAQPVASPPPPSAPVRRESAPVVHEEAPSLPHNADHAAIALVLKTAAKTGVPFCEECAKAAQTKSVVPPVTPPPAVEQNDALPKNADQAGIAKGLQAAAQDGTPFCEECMKAAQGGAHG